MLDQLGLSGLCGIMNSQNYNSQLHQNNVQAQWTAAMAQQKPQWVFNGITCNSVRDMANIIWPIDCPEKTHFILKHE
jgi:hypothetical protein